jgi:hypothetical protein
MLSDSQILDHPPFVRAEAEDHPPSGYDSAFRTDLGPEQRFEEYGAEQWFGVGSSAAPSG